MDYGPFGFMDAYDPYFAKWTGSASTSRSAINQRGRRQPAARASVSPLLAGGEEEAMAIVAEMEDVFEEETKKTWRRKMGFFDDVVTEAVAARADALWEDRLEPLLRAVETDFVVAFRRLADVVAAGARLSDSDDALFEMITPAFYDATAVEITDQDSQTRRDWIAFLRDWRGAVTEAHGGDRNVERVAARMNATNPKFVLREWMLVEAYEAAKISGDFTPCEALQRLTSRPYEEGTEEETAKYFRPAPDRFRDAGTAFMS